MKNRQTWLSALLAAVSILGACGGGSSSSGPTGTQATVSGVEGPDGTPAVYRPGMLPAPSGTLTVTVPESGTGINGGSVMVPIDAGATVIVKVYVGVEGESGYWELAVPAGATLADVLLTLARQLPATTDSVTIVFEAADAAGNVSAPVTLVIAVTHVGTGDIQVSISWDVDNDIDLHVVDPNGFEVYWEQDDPSPEGGNLDLDSNAACIIDSVRNENIVWPANRAPHGTYTVLVDNFENCTGTAVQYVVTVQKAGQAAQTFTGTFAADDPGDQGGAGEGVTVTTFTYP